MTPARGRGRRRAGGDTRTALLAAAREVFAEQGYEAATVRAIAARAGVDAAMVNHWFGGKQALFGRAVLELPFQPEQIVARLLDSAPGEIGARAVRTFLSVWDPTGGGAMAALVRSVAAQEIAAAGLRDLFVRHVFEPVCRSVMAGEPAERAELRASLAASQMIGLGMARYVLKFEPLASAEPDSLVATVGPTVQHYLTGDLSGSGKSPQFP